MKVSNIWLGLFFVTLITFAVYGFSTYEKVPYMSSLWWDYSKHTNVTIFFHTLCVGVAIFIYYLGIAFFRPAEVCNAHELDRNTLLKILSKSHSSRGYFSLLKDKEFISTDSKDSFIMYGTTSKNYISLGDPICENIEDIPKLLNKFYELSQINDKNIVFYEISEEYLKFYLDLGLKVIKVGEEAIVDLESFTLEGPKNKKLRYINSKLGKKNFRFEVVDDFKSYSKDLKIISDEWLKSKKASEKSFSLGSFNEEYLSNFPIALLYYEDELVAFSNLLITEDKNEIAIDLMRYIDKTPTNTMDYLFIQIILWAKSNNYKNFSLGAAPLSGIESSIYSGFWNRYAGYIFENSDSYYNFKGLKRFKNKFFPRWESRYVAYSGNFNLIRSLLDVSSLISGGLSKTFKK